MRKIAAVMVSVSMFFICAYAALADEHPNEFWAMDRSYQNARNEGNLSDIIKYGMQEIELYRALPDSASKRDITVSRYSEIASSYEQLEEWENAAAIYEALASYAAPLDEKYAEIVKGAKKKADQYMPAMDLYTDGGTNTYYGEKNEKQNGVLFGLCANGETRGSLDNESMVLVYQEFGQHVLPYNDMIIRQAASEGIAVELALNCPNEAEDIRNIEALTPYLEEVSDLLSGCGGIPVYLRFAAEFDVWTNMAGSEEYKHAFRYASDFFRSRNQNTAMVWSPNQAANWTLNINDYYPGDEYVDWVGISSYANKYFLDGNVTADEALFFKSGINSEPVITLKEIIEQYGDRKPIMVSESGCGHTFVETGEDTTDFALRRLREYYSYLPIVYPQIKLMAYFDHYISGAREKTDYRLSSNAALRKEYLRLTSGGRFIQDSFENEVSLRFKKLSDGAYVGNTFLASCYARRYNNETAQVTYFIDGKYAGMSDQIPFSTYISAEGLSGEHILSASASFADGSVMTTEKKINIMNGSDITVQISGKDIAFDQKPVIFNERTLVPMRPIFEALGAEVSWDSETQTAVGEKDGRLIKISVGSNRMYVNDKPILLDTSPIILNGRTLVPARAVAEGMGCEVNWDGSSQLVSITKEGAVALRNSPVGLIEFRCRTDETHPPAYDGTPSGEFRS